MKIFLLCLVCLTTNFVKAQEARHVKVTILSTMLADLQGKGEWGFSALVQVDSDIILFDTGKHPDLVLENAKALGVDLSGIKHLVLSHNHLDHTGGAERLWQQFPGSFLQTYIGPNFFLPKLVNGKTPMKSFDSAAYENGGRAVTVINSFKQIIPGVYLTGSIPRIHNEENYPKTTLVKTKNGLTVDVVEEEISLVVNTGKGLILVSGCGHAGIVNTLEHVKKNLPGKKIIAAIGGFHLLDTEENKVVWTAQQLTKAGINYFLGAHCTGLNSVYKIRQVTGLPPDQCLIGSVGTIFDNHAGFKIGWMK